ncbi:MAG TPA: nucleotide exchange factor GrpE [Anaerolineales bacterium]
MTKKKHESTEVNMNEEQKAVDGASPAQQENMPGEVDNTLAEVAALEEVEQLKKELAESRSKADEYLDGWQRSRAEFANYKKRVDRDQSQIHQAAAGVILKRYLEILDDLDRALKNRPQNGDGAGWAAGIELIYRKFMAILDAEGVKVMEAEGKIFDPNLHEAISQSEVPGYESGQIVEVIQKGYILGDRVLRPALVRVAK